jgi:CelD/BcsL family acetyltransferase involved in cellulose biosynthesis
MVLEQQTLNSVNSVQNWTDGLHVSMTSDMKSVELLWRDWATNNHCTVFQSYDWCRLWLENCGVNAVPCLISATHQNGEFAFFLPLCIEGRVLKFIGQDEAIYGGGVLSAWALTDEGHDWFSRNAQSLLRLNARANRIQLNRMPNAVDGRPNPLLSLANLRDPDTCSILDLTDDFDKLLASKRSTSTRSNMRNRDKRIAQAGETSFEVLSSSREAHSALDQLLDDQAARLLENGIADPVDPDFRRSLHQWLDADTSQLRVFRLTVAGETIASILASFHKDTVVFLMIALADSPLRKFSPGDLILRQVIEVSIKEGYKYFDFSLGASPYKLPWQDRIISQHHAVRALSLDGVVGTCSSLAKHALRKILKSNPSLWNSYVWARRNLRGKAAKN